MGRFRSYELSHLLEDHFWPALDPQNGTYYDSIKIDKCEEHVLGRMPNSIKERHLDDDGKAFTFCKSKGGNKVFLMYVCCPDKRAEMAGLSNIFTFYNDVKVAKISNIMRDMMKLKKRAAKAAGYKSHAEFMFVKGVSGSVEDAEWLLEDKKNRLIVAEREVFAEIKKFAKTRKMRELRESDYYYLLNEMAFREKRRTFMDLESYLPADGLVDRISSYLDKLLGIKIQVVKGSFPGVPDDHCFLRVLLDGDTIGEIKVILYGQEARVENVSQVEGQLPRCDLYAAVNNPSKHGPHLFSWADLERFLHELGHALEKLIARHGGHDPLGWDSVEVISKFMENLMYHYPALQEMTSHIDSKKPLDKDSYLEAMWFERKVAPKENLDFNICSRFDLLVHGEYPPVDAIKSYINMREGISSIFVPDHRCELFDIESAMHAYDGYFYIYETAENIALSLIDKIATPMDEINSSLGLNIRNEILLRGSSREFKESYYEVMGKDLPGNDAFFSHHYIE